MTATYDLETNVGKLRLLLQDTDTDDVIFQDEELQVFLSQKGNDLYLAASTVMLALANDKARLAKRKRASKYEHDLTKLANECREQAKVFREEAENIPADDYAEMGITAFQRRDIMRKL